MGTLDVSNGNFVVWTRTQTTLLCCCVSVLMLLQNCCVNVMYVGILCTICDCCDRTLRTRTGKVWVKRNRWSGSTVFCSENWSSWMQGLTACVRNAASASVRPAQPPQPPPSAPPLAHHPLALPRSLVGSVFWGIFFHWAFEDPESFTQFRKHRCFSYSKPCFWAFFLQTQL